MDVPHLFGFLKVIRNQEKQVLSKIYGWHLVKIWSTFGLKWVVMARIGLKLGGNEATRFRIIFKPHFYVKKRWLGSHWDNLAGLGSRASSTLWLLPWKQ